MKKYGQVLRNVDLKDYNSYGIGKKAKYLIKPYPDKIISLLEYLEQNNLPYYILGSGTNVILPDNDFKGVIIKLDNFNKLEIKDNKLIAGAGVLLSKAIIASLNSGYGNLVNLLGIPGTIGAATIGNIGSFGSSFYDYLESILIIDENRELKTLKKEEIKYGYRDTEFKKRKIIVLEVILNLVEGQREEYEKIKNDNYQKRKETQPLDTKNAGSVFKNPPLASAGKLIEEAGLKGYKIGGAMVSTKHANFIINYANAQSSDIIKLINEIKKIIKEKNNIDLELEQIIVKWE